MDTKRFGQWLQSEREARGWSQAEFARRCGKTRTTLSKIENGTTLPGLHTFVAFSLVLELSPMELLRKLGLLPELPAREATFEQWEHLLRQMDPVDEEELRQIAQLKIVRHKNTDHKRIELPDELK